ncbi:MAG: type I DNA topoisomerase [Clostridia bacterium]|nr:type I DNA topoisomerase [Clostridia bacterium]
MKLVIVESPAKAKTIEKYLGKDYVVEATRGHVCDLPVSTMGVEVENDFKPKYEVRSKEQKETVARLKKRLETCDGVLLATDPDREGEAISWHLANILKLNTGDKNRIQFNEISKKAVQKAIEDPRTLDMDLVNAQQARRVLDRLVGYTISPVLCKKVQNKLSAGRVQSAALKMLVDREKEIEAFKPEEYWTITARLEKTKNPPVFKADLTEFQGKKYKVQNQEEAENVLANLQGAQYVVQSVKESTTYGKPPAPFTTSTMQQDAIAKLKMSASTVRSVSQQLYEGLNIAGLGHVALVTYIRTDSTRVSDEAKAMAKKYIVDNYGAQYVPDVYNNYSTGKNAQDAHEAIRPINLDVTPESIKDKVQRNHYNLYKLIYDRFLASQSTKPKYANVTVRIDANDYTFVSTGKTVLFDGYTKFYGESKKADNENAKMPKLAQGDLLKLNKLEHEQRFTKGPARYTEASLIKAMEEKGIGRPSTFDSIMAVLYKRTYMEKSEKALVPTQLGKSVTEFLDKNFKNYVDVGFTAEMETNLDSVEDGTRWQDVVSKYYTPLVGDAKKAMSQNKMQLEDQPCDLICEKCGSKMVIKHGRYGDYYACVNYPSTCDYHFSCKAKQAPVLSKEVCDKCGSPMYERAGKYGKYLACSNYPTCKNTRSLVETVAVCPICGKDVAKRVSKKGKVFYGCVGYPDCSFISWDIPLKENCPQCGSYLVNKEGKGKVVACSNKDCNYKK